MEHSSSSDETTVTRNDLREIYLLLVANGEKEKQESVERLRRERTKARASRSRKIESPSLLFHDASPRRGGQVYLFVGAMRFLARDQVSNVLASRGTVLSAPSVLLRREKKSSIRIELPRATDRRRDFIFSRRGEKRKGDREREREREREDSGS